MMIVFTCDTHETCIWKMNGYDYNIKKNYVMLLQVIPWSISVKHCMNNTWDTITLFGLTLQSIAK